MLVEGDREIRRVGGSSGMGREVGAESTQGIYVMNKKMRNRESPRETPSSDLLHVQLGETRSAMFFLSGLESNMAVFTCDCREVSWTSRPNQWGM